MLALQSQLWISGLTFLILGGLIMWRVRYEYLDNGKLTPLTAFLQAIAFGLQMVFTSLSVWGSIWPSWDECIPKNWVGGLLLIVGLVLCGLGMWAFRSMTRVTGLQTDGLVVKGIYKYSRTPQYVGYGLLILGFVIGHWISTAWLALLSHSLLVAVTIWIEEQYLENKYGDAYRDYCQRVPRFVGKILAIDEGEGYDG